MSWLKLITGEKIVRTANKHPNAVSHLRTCCVLQEKYTAIVSFVQTRIFTPGSHFIQILYLSNGRLDVSENLIICGLVVVNFEEMSYESSDFRNRGICLSKADAGVRTPASAFEYSILLHWGAPYNSRLSPPTPDRRQRRVCWPVWVGDTRPLSRGGRSDRVCRRHSASYRRR